MADTSKRNEYGEWAYTSKGQPVVDNVPLRHECEGASDRCMHCGVDMTAPALSWPCDALERARCRAIRPETIAAFGCDAEAKGFGSRCEKWCQRPECPYTRATKQGGE